MGPARRSRQFSPTSPTRGGGADDLRSLCCQAGPRPARPGNPARVCPVAGGLMGPAAGLGRIASTLTTVLIAFASAGALAFVITTQIAALARELPQHQSEIEAKLERLRGSDGPFLRRHHGAGTGETSPPRCRSATNRPSESKSHPKLTLPRHSSPSSHCSSRWPPPRSSCN